jgi:hypothetical protein
MIHNGHSKTTWKISSIVATFDVTVWRTEQASLSCGVEYRDVDSEYYIQSRRSAEGLVLK